MAPPDRTGVPPHISAMKSQIAFISLHLIKPAADLVLIKLMGLAAISIILHIVCSIAEYSRVIKRKSSESGLFINASSVAQS